MTTNAGAQELSARRVGFGSEGQAPGNAKNAIERAFSPEFRNRLDAWVSFESLPADVVVRIVDKFVAGLAEQLLEKKVKLELTPEARTWFAEHGFDPRMGARPMARLIQNEIKKPLAEKILFGELQAGGTVRVDLDLELDKPRLVVVPTAAPVPA